MHSSIGLGLGFFSPSMQVDSYLVENVGASGQRPPSFQPQHVYIHSLRTGSSFMFEAIPLLLFLLPHAATDFLPGHHAFSVVPSVPSGTPSLLTVLTYPLLLRGSTLTKKTVLTQLSPEIGVLFLFSSQQCFALVSLNHHSMRLGYAPGTVLGVGAPQRPKQSSCPWSACSQIWEMDPGKWVIRYYGECNIR